MPNFDPDKPEPGITYLMAAVPDGEPMPELQAGAAVYAEAYQNDLVLVDGPVRQRRKTGGRWFTLYTWAARAAEPLTPPPPK